MNGGAVRVRLPDGRWHFQHGPIDLLIGMSGDSVACADALEAAWQRFQPLLADLVAELPALRQDSRERPRVRGPVACRMVAACAPLARTFDLFLTPMAAVAGSVAEELATCFERPGIERAFLNNGGDIALVLAPAASFDVGVVTDVDAPALDARLRVTGAGSARGVATSGWRGRSLSLGIADSVTVIACNASRADAAATLIANAVDCDDARIHRAPANTLRDNSDLGERLATVSVPRLSVAQVDGAIRRGAQFAQRCIAAGFIQQAMVSLQGRHQPVGVMTQIELEHHG